MSSDDMTSPPTLCLVVPVCSSKASLPELIRHLETVVRSAPTCLQAILVYDGGRDRSWTVTCQIVGQHGFISCPAGGVLRSTLQIRGRITTAGIAVVRLGIVTVSSS